MRKPSLKVKRRFSLKRRESVKENRPNKYTIKLPDEPIIPPPKPIGSSPEPKTTAPYMGDNLLEIPPEVGNLFTGQRLEAWQKLTLHRIHTLRENRPLMNLNFWKESH